MSRAELLLNTKGEPVVEADPTSINGWRVVIGDGAVPGEGCFASKRDAEKWADDFTAWRLAARDVLRRLKLAERAPATDAPLVPPPPAPVEPEPPAPVLTATTDNAPVENGAAVQPSDLGHVLDRQGDV